MGPPKNPSARRGIHDYSQDPDRNMVTYDSDDTDEEVQNAEEDLSNDDLGVDEVDFPHESRKYKTKIVKNHRRRNSFNLSHENQISIERLAQSLPSTFPSPLSSSDRWKPPVWQNTSLPPRLETPEQELSFSSDIRNINLTHHNDSAENKQGTKIFSIVLIVTTLLTVAIGIWWKHDKADSVGSLVDEQTFINELNTLGVQYSINEDIILLIQSGISTIFQNQDAGSFIFVYNSKTKSFDKNMFNNFITNIAATAARYLRKDSKFNQQVEHIEIEPSKLGIETHSELIQKYREEVSRTGLMLVKDIDKLPSNLAMAFHYYCDEYNPLVKRSAIFFTIDIANCSAPAQQPPNHAYIEKCLAKKWINVPKDNIGPLLTRVVGTIVDTTSTI